MTVTIDGLDDMSVEELRATVRRLAADVVLAHQQAAERRAQIEADADAYRRFKAYDGYCWNTDSLRMSIRHLERELERQRLRHSARARGSVTT